MRSRGFFPHSTLVFALAVLPAACFSDRGTPTVAGSGAPTGVEAGVRGCAASTRAMTAPNGYYVSGSTVCTENGEPHLFHGVDRPSLEFEPGGDHISSIDFEVMATWNANVVRIALNQDYWLPQATLYSSGYEDEVKQAVAWAEAAGLDVILDLHWSDRGDLTVPTAGGMTKQDANGGSNQQQMADTNSITFWGLVAADFKNDGRVMFELYNEPNGIPWGVWLNGGEAAGFQVAGMQQLYQAVRDQGAQNIVIAGGLDYAYDLSQVSNYLISGYNIIYATHPYDKSDAQPGTWETKFGYLATQNIAPVIATEFGDTATKDVNGVRVDACSGAWDTQLIAFLDSHQISWTAWAFYPGDCAFPSLIADWDYTPTVQGVVIKAALGGYPAGAWANDAGTDGSAPSGRDASEGDVDTSDTTNADLALTGDASGTDGATGDATAQ